MTYPCNKLLTGFLLHKKGEYISLAPCNTIPTLLNFSYCRQKCYRNTAGKVELIGRMHIMELKTNFFFNLI